MNQCGRQDGPACDGGKRNALRFIILMGIVSLLADVTYEGARGIVGPYLSLLGASAGVVGFVGGLGELTGYGFRLISGYWADRTRRYWLIAITGYAVNLLAVPLLAFAGRWEVAACLIVAERMGKAIRAPSRDAMLSYACRQVGTGVGFGLHETLDQIGAVAGPLLVAITLMLRQNRYEAAFLVLAVPAVFALAVLALGRHLYPNPRLLEAGEGEAARDRPDERLPRVFWIYGAFAVAAVAGFAHFQLISFHFKVQGMFRDAQIPILFGIAMGVDALVALPLGYLFDKKGLATLAILPALSIPVPLLVFASSPYLASVGVVLWGAAMAVQETVMRGAIAELIPPGKRAMAYGIFNTGYGLAWFLGSTAMGILYGAGKPYLVGFAIAMELASLPLMALVCKNAPARGRSVSRQ